MSESIHFLQFREYKRDDRCLFLYVHSDDFQIYFASDPWRVKFNGYVHQITEGFEETGFIADLDTEVQSATIPVRIRLNCILHQGNIII
jgi:hypothetical protein